MYPLLQGFGNPQLIGILSDGILMKYGLWNNPGICLGRISPAFFY